jgi:hypothetical protein
VEPYFKRWTSVVEKLYDQKLAPVRERPLREKADPKAGRFPGKIGPAKENPLGRQGTGRSKKEGRTGTKGLFPCPTL